MEDKINSRESKDGLLESLLGFLNEFFSSEWYTMSGVKYLSPEMRRNLYNTTSRGVM